MKKWTATLLTSILLCSYLLAQPSQLPNNGGAGQLPNSGGGGGGFLTPDSYGASPLNADNSSQLNAWLADCAARQLICYIPTPPSGPYLASTIAFPAGGVVVQGSGSWPTLGSTGPAIKQVAGTNANFITITPVLNVTGRPLIRDLTIDGNSQVNTSGHVLYLPQDTVNSYGAGIDLYNVQLNNCPTDCLNVEANRNNGHLVHSYLKHAANNGLTLAASDWRSDYTEFGLNTNFGISQTQGADFQIHSGAIYTNLIGYNLSNNSVNPRVSIIGVVFNGNLQNAISMNTSGICQEDLLVGNHFVNNSTSATGMYSDILLTNACGIVISGNSFNFVATQSKYLIETSGATAYVSGISFDLTRLPYATAATNDATKLLAGSVIGSGNFSGPWFTGGTSTTTKPQLLIEPGGTTSNNWNTNGTGIGVNAPSGFGGPLIDLQVAASEKFNVDQFGDAIASGNVSAGASARLTWTGRGILTSPAAAAVQFGAVDAASPAGQTIGMQNVVAGNANTAGANTIIRGSLSNGSGAGGDVTFQTTASAAGSGVQNSGANALTIKGGTQQVITAAAVADTGFDYTTPTTGQTVTIPNTAYHEIIDPAGTLAALTVNLPSAPTNGTYVDVRFSQVITALTVSGNGNSIAGNPTSAAVGSQFGCIFRSANTKWYC